MDGQPVDLVFLLLAPEGAAPITSRRWPASHGCYAIRTSPRNCAPRASAGDLFGAGAAAASAA
jgi:hypothetical protein